jgi:mono/diheme cytochrome c family protein
MRSRPQWWLFAAASAVLLVAMYALWPAATSRAEASSAGEADASVLRGRVLIIQHACGDCHGGFANPAAKGWLAGAMSEQQIFQIGPFTTYPRNLTPDNATGIGRFSERQLFNAIRFGLRPGETPDVEITSATPGEGNHPAHPRYLAPPMPWFAFRHLPDQDIRDIAAYLKRGVRPVSNRVLDSEGPPDFWASEYAEEKVGTYPAPPFPTENEQVIAKGVPQGSRD